MANFHKHSWTVSNQGPETVVANLLYDEKNDKLTSCEASLLDGEGTETKIDTQHAEVRFIIKKLFQSSSSKTHPNSYTRVEKRATFQKDIL